MNKQMKKTGNSLRQKKKLQDNVTCEIMQCILEEARNAYEAVHEVQSNTVDDLEANVERVQEWLRAQKLW